MVKALLSVKPEYAEKILSGEKIYEFRRRIFKRKDVDILVIYATRPQCRVVADAIELRSVRRFGRPRTLSEYAPEVKSAPQSFIYVD